MRRRSRWTLLGLLLLAGGGGLLAGCGSLGYFSQSVSGHLGVMRAARPVDAWLADASTPADLRERLALSQRIRDFAVSTLALPDNPSYRRYADLGRPSVVWNVVAAPELSLKLKTWCFPVAGCVGYRGYFDRDAAEAEAASLRAEGLEANVYGVPAYSTLGKLPGAFFADPLLSTFIRYPEGELARLIFHELAHQVVYAADDTEFNEGFATAVERLGGGLWLADASRAAARDEYLRFDARRHAFRQLVLATRAELQAVYDGPASDDAKRAAKAEVMSRMRTQYEALKAGPWDGFRGYDRWFERANNASIGVHAAYHRLVPAFEALFEREGRDFPRFYAAVQALAERPKGERQARLDALLPPAPALQARAGQPTHATQR